MIAALEDIDLSVPAAKVRWSGHPSDWAHRLVYEILEGRVERPLFAVTHRGADRIVRIRIPQGLSLGDAEGLVTSRASVPELAAGEERRFVLTFNPARHLTKGGHSIPVNDEEAKAAFDAKAEAAGFVSVSARVSRLPPIRFRPSPARPHITQSQALAAGVLRVVDGDRFSSAVRTGIGLGKAYGLGLLILL